MRRQASHTLRWRWLLLVPLLFVLATLYVFISDSGTGYASSAFERLQQTVSTAAKLTSSVTGASISGGDSFSGLKPVTVGLDSEPEHEQKVASFQAKVKTELTKQQERLLEQQKQAQAIKQPPKEQKPAVQAAPQPPHPSPPATASPAQHQGAGGVPAVAAAKGFTPDPKLVANYREMHRQHKVIVPGGRKLHDTPEAHCPLTKGGWCGGYWTQPLLPPRPPPRFDKPCPSDCNNVGVCNHSTGKCRCPAGWKGDGCEAPQQRLCYNMGLDKRDMNITDGGWVHTRCSGVCDDRLGMCHCPPETKYGRKYAPNAKPHDKPLQEGRPMYWCNPNKTESGKTVPWSWNTYTYEGIFGPNGFCNSDSPLQRCGCTLDGWVGPNCDQRVTQFCANQCSGNGECQLGFCKCRYGWYGHDCSQRKKGLPYAEPGFTLPANLGPVVMLAPASIDPPQRPFRRRPFIYVYELPPRYNELMLQYRLEGGICIYRRFDGADKPQFVDYNAYSLETVLHELMLSSEHRTLDPEEADYFYLPVYVSCLADMVGKAPQPFWPADENGSGRWGDRPYRMSMMVYEAKQWIEQNLPYWNRTGGRDHIWVFTHDEAPCYQHHSLWNSIWLTHWGRMDFPHGSNSSYHADNYSRQSYHTSLPDGWLAHTSHKHACHDPANHLVVPVFKQPSHYHNSIYLGKKPVERDILAFFRGDMGLRREGCTYSRCIRQTLWKLNRDNKWQEKYNVVYGDRSETQGSYTELLARSKFCLVIPGDGWSARYEDSMTHGCVPIIIMDNTLGPFESLIDYSKFAIRLPEKDLAKLIEVLQAVSDAQYKELQRNIASVWMRFRWNSLALAESLVLQAITHNTGGSGVMHDEPGTQWAQTGDDDAFSTVIQWLYSRLPEMDKLHEPYKSGGTWAANRLQGP